MSKIDLDLVGQIFGEIVILGKGKGREYRSGKVKSWIPSWIGRCRCGEKKDFDHYKLLSGHTKSCGCLRESVCRDNFKKHGDKGSKEYSAWIRMKGRCLSKTNAKYKRYGARGITVCEKWIDDYPQFLKDMGRCPPGKTSIGRIDNDGNYEKKNCRWEDNKQQSNNRSTSITKSYRGEQLTIKGIAEFYDLPYNTILARHHAGWSTKDIIEKPIRKIKTTRSNK